LSITYPSSSPVLRLERKIIPDPTAPAVDFELKIFIRESCSLPIGFHPCFHLPQTPGGATIETSAILGHTYPGTVEPGASLFLNGFQEFTSLTCVPTQDKKTIDASKVPFDKPIEELLQIHNTDCIMLANHIEGYRVKLNWNKDHFPSVLLWYSNGGRQEYPWKGRHYCLGMEPVNSPFGLGPSIAVRANPMNERGIPTARNFVKDEIFVTQYKLSAEPLNQVD